MHTIDSPNCYRTDDSTGLRLLVPPLIENLIPGLPTTSWAEIFEDKEDYVSGEDFVSAYAYTLTRSQKADFDLLVGDGTLATHRANFAASLFLWAERSSADGSMGIPIGRYNDHSKIKQEAEPRD